MLRSATKTSLLSPPASSRPSTKKRKRTRRPTRSSVARSSRKKRKRKRKRRTKRKTKKKTKRPKRKTALKNAKRFAPAKRKPSPRMLVRQRSRLSRHALWTLTHSAKRKQTPPTKARCTPLPSAITKFTRKLTTNTNPSKPPEPNPRPRPPPPKTTVSFFPAKHAPRAPALPNPARISRATPRPLAPIPAHASSGLIAAADAIATTAAETIAAVAGQIVAAALPVAVLHSDAGPAVPPVIQGATPDPRA